LVCLAEEQGEQRLDGVHAVLSLVEDDGLIAIEDVVSRFNVTIDGQGMHDLAGLGSMLEDLGGYAPVAEGRLVSGELGGATIAGLGADSEDFGGYPAVDVDEVTYILN